MELKFEYDKETRTVTLCGVKGEVRYGEHIVIPKTVDYYNKVCLITKIGFCAFNGCTSLKSIVIPEGVTSIGSYAFSGCSSLTSITIPSSVTSIGSYAFSGCSSLTSITIPNSVTDIGWGAFSGCRSLTSITMPSSVTEIGNGAFRGCSSLTSITIPKCVKRIGQFAFTDCTSLKSIEISEGVTEIEMSAFYCCSSLTSITIPNSVTSIGESAFCRCSSLTSITIPKCVKRIEDSVFLRCSSLKSIEIPQSVTKIGGSAFYDIPSLKVKIYNEEGEVIIHPVAFSSDAVIEYVGQKKSPKQESEKTKTPKAETEQEEITAPVIDLDKLINAVVADGVVTDKEREVILKKAKTAGYDVDEVEILLDGKLAEKQAQNTPAPVVDKKKEEKVVSTPKAEPTPKKDASKTKEEVNSVGGRDYSKYSVNGEGSYGKARMVEAVVNKYIELNPNITIDKLKEIFPDKLQGTVLIEYSAENIKDMKRFYESTLPNGTKFYISNQWGTQIDTFIKHVDCAIDNITVTKLQNK